VSVSRTRKPAIAERRGRAVGLHARGFTKVEIAARMNAGRSMISCARRAIRAEWLATRARKFATREIKLPKVDGMEAEQIAKSKPGT
jgi:hypothetical protein